MKLRKRLSITTSFNFTSSTDAGILAASNGEVAERLKALPC